MGHGRIVLPSQLTLSVMNVPGLAPPAWLGFPFPFFFGLAVKLGWPGAKHGQVQRPAPPSLRTFGASGLPTTPCHSTKQSRVHFLLRLSAFLADHSCFASTRPFHGEHSLPLTCILFRGGPPLQRARCRRCAASEIELTIVILTWSFDTSRYPCCVCRSESTTAVSGRCG